MPAPRETRARTVGRYVLYGELASGGMATVHLGRLSGPEGFSRTVAIKRLHPQFAKDARFVEMFRDEARLVGRIRHPNVVPTLDVVTTDGEIFIVMEYVAGEAFSKLLSAAASKGETAPPKVVATIVSSVLHGLHAAHQTRDERGVELGIVHRDVSPQNILVGIDGAARLLDFGVAKAAGRLQTTREGELKGKIGYMAPEQLHGSQATPQADVYAAAVVLWEALTQRRLFDGENEAVVLARALKGVIDPPSKYNPQLDASVDALVLRGLARDPAQRFATAREMALVIERSMGVASSSDVSDWVERLAHESLRQRAEKVAAVEVAAPESTAPETWTPADSHSELSSITVSHPSVALAEGGAPPRKLRALTAAFVVLASVGVTLAALSQRDGHGATRAQNVVANSARRELDRMGPPLVAERAAVAKEQPAPQATVAAVVRQPEAKADSCDPPYIIDAAGRRSYKRHCL